MAEQSESPRPESSANGLKPAVIADDAHVEYHVLTTGKRARKPDTGGRVGGSGKRMRKVHALKGVSFTAYENDSIGVIGHNGSGKSTLMRAIAGLTPVSAGAIYASGRPSLLGVGAAMLRQLSGQRNVIIGGLALGMSLKEIRERYDDIVDFAGIREFIDMPMRTYSSGMSARLQFAIATAQDHETLIIDEALAVGDRHFRKRSEERIRQIRDNAGTVFLVSHSMKSISDTCNRVLWIDNGTLVMDGATDDVIAAYQDS